MFNNKELNRENKPFLPVKPVSTGCDYDHSRLRIWMIDSFFNCPVVGICLSLEERKRVLRKTGHFIKNLNAFEIHETCVSNLSGEKHSRPVHMLAGSGLSAISQALFKYQGNAAGVH